MSHARSRVPLAIHAMAMAFAVILSFDSRVTAQTVTSPRRPYAPAYSTQGSAAEAMQARLLGYLIYRNVNVYFVDTPIKEAMAEFSRQIGVTIVGRYSDDKAGYGIDPETTITASMQDMNALVVLEEILAQCSDSGDCTWQLRRAGYIEIGTKDRLAVPAAREMRTYHVRDLMLEPPKFASPLEGGRTERKSPEQLIEELFGTLVDTVEPDAWVEDPPAEEATDRNVPRPEGQPQPDHSTATPQRRVTTEDEHNRWKGKAEEGLLKVKGKWGTMRVFRDQLIVNAPDFIHRQLNGYPKAIEPPPLPPCPTDRRGEALPVNSPPASQPAALPASPTGSATDPKGQPGGSKPR